MREAYRRCRLKRGAAGVDGETFERIEAHGVERWLGNLQQELQAKTYQPQPLLRVWIPKSNGDNGSGALFRSEAALDVRGDFGLGRAGARTSEATSKSLKWPIP